MVPIPGLKFQACTTSQPLLELLSLQKTRTSLTYQTACAFLMTYVQFVAVMQHRGCQLKSQTVKNKEELPKPKKNKKLLIIIFRLWEARYIG